VDDKSIAALVTTAGWVSYGLVGLYTARAYYQDRYREWMDKAILHHQQEVRKLTAKGKEVKVFHEELLAVIRGRWREESDGSEDARFDSIFAGLAWPWYWVKRWMDHKPEPSVLEARVMDEAAYQRLRELERRAGLKPLEGPED
jgi:hypothetical protein